MGCDDAVLFRGGEAVCNNQAGTEIKEILMDFSPDQCKILVHQAPCKSEICRAMRSPKSGSACRCRDCGVGLPHSATA